jgi:uncharacterized protein
LGNNELADLSWLKQMLARMQRAVVAYSGGVDSTLLLKLAADVLGKKNVLAVTVISEVFADWELEKAQKIAAEWEIEHLVLQSHDLNNPQFIENNFRRCYFCKKELFTKIKKLAGENGFEHVIDGSNLDDLDDHRPGLKALAELNIISPLKQAKFRKADIRKLAKEMGLANWNKPAFACFASRFVYGNKITAEGIKQIKEGEMFLLDLGFKQVRLRHHDTIARIELCPADMIKLNQARLREKIVKKIRTLGFVYVTLDLQGYRQGSMNEVWRN